MLLKRQFKVTMNFTAQLLIENTGIIEPVWCVCGVCLYWL